MKLYCHSCEWVGSVWMDSYDSFSCPECEAPAFDYPSLDMLDELAFQENLLKVGFLLKKERKERNEKFPIS